MQDVRALLLKAMNYQYPEEIPIFVGILPAAKKFHGEALFSILRKYPAFFDIDALENHQGMPISYYAGAHVDPWGCVWTNLYEGMEAYVTGHPIPHRADIPNFKAPKEDMGIPHGFMYLRLLDLRGFDEAMLDFADECQELKILIETVCAYNVRQMELFCRKDSAPIVFVGDDLGMQKGIAIGPEKWRTYLKPAFKRIYDVAHAAGRFIYMHTDGDIIDIMPDIMETGVNIINPQYRANGLDRLEKSCKGKIPIALDLDRQLFPFGSPLDMHDHLREAVQRLYLTQGGLALNIELNLEVPLENIEALLSCANEMRSYRGQ